MGGSLGYPGKGQRAKAARKYMEQAATIQQQINAVQGALDGSFKKALRKRLRNINRVSGGQDDSLLSAYDSRVTELKKASEDNEAAAAGQSYQNLTNRGRERANAMSQASLQGAGETDLLQSQQMALRNWSQNQTDINQAQTDTARSIQASMTDLHEDTRTARENVRLQALSDKETLHNEYYDQVGAAQNQLGNLYGQQAELYGYAIEAKGNKKVQKKLRRARRKAGDFWDAEQESAGMAWRNPGVGSRINDWEGDSIPEIGAPPQTLNSSSISEMPKAPSGASLRKW
jgi:hypothetical protein